MLLALSTSDSRVLKDPAPTTANVKLIDLGTQIELRCWCKNADFGGLGSDLIAKPPKALAEAGIKGPDRTVYYVERK